MRTNFLLPFVLAGLFWFLVVRPQRQRVRHHRDLLAGLQPGDEVVTAAGFVGRLVDLGPELARLELAPGTVVTVLRPAIQRKMEPRMAVDSIEAVEPLAAVEPAPGPEPAPEAEAAPLPDPAAEQVA